MSRGILACVPVFLLMGGLRLCARTPLDFSTRPSESSAVPTWAISLDYILLGLPFVLLGIWGSLHVWRKTSLKFSIDWFHAPLGLLGVVPNLFALWLVGDNPWSSFSYNWDSPGALEGALYSMLTTVVLAGAWAAIAWLFLYLYISGIVPEGTGKYDKRPGEADGVGTLLDQMKHSGHSP